MRVIPPYLLESIATRGTPAQREAALRTLAKDTTVRHARAVNAASGGRGSDALAGIEPAAPDRTIFDAAHGTAVTGLKTLRSEGDPPTGDAAADEAYDGLGHTYSFWLDVFGRRSIDDADL